MITQQECHACCPRTGFNHNTWGFNHQQEGIQVGNPRIEAENSFLFLFEYVWMRTAMEHMENNMKTLVCFLLNKATKPWRNPPSMARPLSNWSLWVCRVLQRMFGPLAAWRSKCAPWLARSLPMIRSHILQFLWTNIEFAGKSSSIFGQTQNGSIHRLFSSWLSWLVEPKAFSRTFCCWATRRSNPPKARKLRPQSDLNMVSAKWLERGNPWEASRKQLISGGLSYWVI